VFEWNRDRFIDDGYARDQTVHSFKLNGKEKRNSVAQRKLG